MLFGYPTFQGYAQLVCPIQYRLWVGFLFCCYFFLRFGSGLLRLLRLLLLLAGIDNEACLDAVIDYASGDVNIIDGVSEDKQKNNATMPTANALWKQRLIQRIRPCSSSS